MSSILYLDSTNLKICKTFGSRLIGMMFKKKKENRVFYFPRCNSIHTFFMFKNIDVIMTDKNNNIINIYINLKPWKLILPQKKVYNIYELDHNLLDLSDKIKIIIK